MAERWDHLERLLVLHGEACVALSLLRCELEGHDGGLLEKMAVRERHLARLLEGMCKVRGAPRDVRAAARRHMDSVTTLLD